MTTPIAPPRAHKRHEALEFGAGVAALIPPSATGDDLRRIMDTPSARFKISEALKMVFDSEEASSKSWQALAGAFQKRFDESFESHVPLSG